MKLLDRIKKWLPKSPVEPIKNAHLVKLDPKSRYILCFDRSIVDSGARKSVAKLMHDKWGIDTIMIASVGNPEEWIKLYEVLDGTD